MSDTCRIFDRTLLARRRDRWAATARAHDFLLARVADDVEERLAAVNRSFARVLDLGSAHGLIGARIGSRPGVEFVIHTDLAPRLLAFAPGLKVVADEEALPFADGSLDLVVSGLALHLVNDLPGALIQIRRALRPDGLMIAALLGGDTLTELRQAVLEAEAEVSGGASPRVAPFADVRDLGALMQRAGFALPVADSERLTVTYADPLALVRELRAMGASNMLAERRRVPMTRTLLFRALAIYQRRFALPNGRVPASFEIITLTAWCPHESQQKPLRPGSATSRLADALGVPERKPD